MNTSGDNTLNFCFFQNRQMLAKAQSLFGLAIAYINACLSQIESQPQNLYMNA